MAEIRVIDDSDVPILAAAMADTLRLLLLNPYFILAQISLFDHKSLPAAGWLRTVCNFFNTSGWISIYVLFRKII
jgi:hypothetical protein